MVEKKRLSWVAHLTGRDQAAVEKARKKLSKGERLTNTGLLLTLVKRAS
jgi:hypothetical protein